MQFLKFCRSRRQVAEERITPEQIVRLRSQIRSQSSSFQFIVVARILETLHLRLNEIFIFNFFFFIFNFIFVINYSSSSWRGSPRRGELAIPLPIASSHLLLRRRARHHRESSFFSVIVHLFVIEMMLFVSEPLPKARKSSRSLPTI